MQVALYTLITCGVWHPFMINTPSFADMAAAIFATDTVTGTGRSVIRSQKFIEWQSELISTRAIYRGHRRFDNSEVSASSGGKFFCKRGRGSSPVCSDIMELGDLEGEEPCRKKKVKTQLSQSQQEDVQRLSMETENMVGQGKVSQDQREAEKRKGRIPPSSSSLPKETVKQGSRLSSRNRSCQDQEVFLPQNRGTKRSKRVAGRLAHEESRPPPLKLPKLHVVLSRQEIQEDWMKITGHKYVGKPRKSTILQWGLGLCTSLTCPSTIRYLNQP